MNFIHGYLSQFDYLTDQEIDLFVQHSYVKNWQSGQVIHEIGKIQYHPGLLLSGLVRFKYLDEKGMDKTIWIGDAGSVLADPISLFDKTSSSIGIEAIEDSLIVHFEDEELNKLQLDHPGLMRFKIENLETSIRELYMRLMFFSTLTPEKRYAHLIENNPSLFKRVQQKYLASYIGITEVSLSRIKKRMKD